MRPKKAKSASNQEQILYDDLLCKLLELLSLYRGMIWITLLRNIALLTHALLPLFYGARGPRAGFPRRLWLGVSRCSRPPREEGSGFRGSWVTPV